MDRDRRLSIIVGSFVIVSLAGLAAASLLLSAGSGIFTPTYRLVAHFGNVQGLLPGAPVWLAGKEVGRVSAVSFGSVGSETPVVVELRVARSVRDRIRSDTLASVQTIGLLGDSYIELSIGGSEAAVLEDGAEIQAVSPASLSEVVATGTRALENIAMLAENVNTVVENFSEASGERQIGELLGSLAKLDDIFEEIRSGNGLLHRLIYGTSSDTEASGDFLEATMRLNSILEKVDHGEGTMGLLINDPTLYEDLKTLVGGAQRSAVVRSLIRMSVDDGN